MKLNEILRYSPTKIVKTNLIIIYQFSYLSRLENFDSYRNLYVLIFVFRLALEELSKGAKRGRERSESMGTLGW